MKRSAFENHMLRKFTTHNANRRSLGTLVKSIDAKTPQMFAGMEEAAALQQEARDIKQWLTDHPTASQEAIAEQRRRLREVLSKITGTVNNHQ